MTDWLKAPAVAANESLAEEARSKLDKYGYPPSALGRLEPLIIQLAALRSCDEKLKLGKASVSVFASDHGIYSEQVSSLDEDTTTQRIERFSEARLVSSLLSKGLRARAELVNLGTRKRQPDQQGVVDRRITAGTANACREPAMTQDQFEEAVEAGLEAVERAEGCDLFIGGDIGPGNTTIAAAMAAAHTRLGAPTMVGEGSGVDAQMRAKKVAVVNRAVSLHLPRLREPEDLLIRLGGFEIVALSASYIASAQRGRVVLVDGYVCTVAAMAALQINPSIKPWLIFAQRNMLEPGHQRVLTSIEATALLDLDVRIGEAVGALLAVPMIQAACAIYNNAR